MNTKTASIDTLRRERLRSLEWKNIAPLQQAVHRLPYIAPERTQIDYADAIRIRIADETAYESKLLSETAKRLKPWRKGPFQVGRTLFIDAEWQSFKKFNLLQPHMHLEDKVVGDIGCNNGYYLFRMIPMGAKKLIGFDPSALYYTQFQFIDRFVQSGIVFEMLGVEHVPLYEHRFDVLFCLGVLYHRPDPIGTLKSLYKGLHKGGELILDTFMIDGEDEVALTPKERYSKIPNIYFIPTANALKNWCHRAGFDSVEILAEVPTDTDEQRKTDWIDTQSLNDFLDPLDPNKTVEGYPAPKRLYVKAYKA